MSAEQETDLDLTTNGHAMNGRATNESLTNGHAKVPASKVAEDDEQSQENIFLFVPNLIGMRPRWLPHAKQPY